ncbi:MAG: sugar transferase [candidate division WOR-3 bacterium]|nr:MAG: sugar transferase [candidate division WOR-3 bacterium]
MKRFIDIIMSLIGLLILAPAWVIIWVSIVVEDGFPVVIKQCRIGKNGKQFNAFKFRSMHKSSLDDCVNVQAHENDTRITRIGRILRNTAIDESPQLLNILLGQMSFVGPRPLLVCEVEVHNPVNFDVRDIPGYAERISVVPGLTGLAQFCASRDLPREEKFKYDLMYIKQRRLLMDIRLILLSLVVTFLGRWETRDKKLPVRCD